MAGLISIVADVVAVLAGSVGLIVGVKSLVRDFRAGKGDQNDEQTKGDEED